MVFGGQHTHVILYVSMFLPFLLLITLLFLRLRFVFFGSLAWLACVVAVSPLHIHIHIHIHINFIHLVDSFRCGRMNRVYMYEYMYGAVATAATATATAFAIVTALPLNACNHSTKLLTRFHLFNKCQYTFHQKL